jgi:hypothetical protein
MRSGVMGWLILVSIDRKIPSRTTAAAKDPIVPGSLQPSWAEGAAEVEPAGLALGLGDVQRRHRGQQDADRHVHEQHPAPRQP